jgi:[ribosomal protein S18]-alanine N-acetyltransferase
VSGADVRLAALTPADEDALAGLFAANAVPDVVRWFDPFPLDPQTARRLTHATGRDRYYGVWLDGELAGLAMLRGWDEGYDVPSYGVLVDRARHGQGIGGAATRLALEQAARLGSTEVRVTVHDDNERSLRLFASSAFVEMSRSGGKVVMQRGVT